MSTIFLSYARGDDEPFVRRLYDDLVKAKFDVWFDRVNMPSRGLTFHQEIREAITDRDRLLLVVGPQAVKSEYVRQEWQYAWFDAEKVVTPILRLGDYPLPIPELTLLHCEDFRNNGEYQAHLKELIRILQEPAPPMGKVIGAPAMPAHFLTRTDRLISLRDALRSGLDSPAPLGGTTTHPQFHGIASVSRQVGLHGMGGIGKSVLANLLARDREVRMAFPDDIVWIGLGSLPNIVSLMQRVHQQLGGDGLFSSEHEGQQKLKELLAQKAVLLVIDDVWRRQDVDAFDVLGPRCRALITTRDAGLLTSIGGTHHLLQLLTDDEALRLLAAAVGVEPANLPIDAHEVLAECGRLPLAIALAGGMAKSGISWSDIRDALREHDLEYISDEHRSEAQHQNLWRMIEVSVNTLTAEEQERLVELVVFPEDSTVPEAAITTLWEITGNVSPRHARKLLTNLKQRSLIQLVEDNRSSSAQPVDSHFFLHDLIHDYGAARYSRSNGDLSVLHSQLLSAYEAKAPHGWWSGQNDGYYFQNLRHHLIAAGRGDDAFALLMDFNWLQANVHAGLVAELCSAMRDAGQGADLQSRDGLGPWYLFIRKNASFLTQNPSGFFHQAYNEPLDSPLYHQAGRRLSKEVSCKELPAFILERIDRRTSWQSSLADPVVLHGHSSVVESIAISHDGQIIVSGSWDNTVRIWNTATGQCRFTHTGHNDKVWCVAISPDEKLVASGSWDDTVRLWNTEIGTCLHVLRHDNRIHDIAFSNDGKFILTLCSHEIRRWDISDGRCVSQIVEHWISDTSGCLFVTHKEDKVLVSGLLGDIREWKGGETTNPVVSGLDILSEANDIAVSDESRLFVAASYVYDYDFVHGVNIVVDLMSHTVLHRIEAHSESAVAITVQSDGSRFASGSYDGTAQLFDTATGEKIGVFSHPSGVRSVALNADGRLLATGANDGLIRVFDLASPLDCSKRDRHNYDVTCVMVSKGGDVAVTGDEYGDVKVWETLSGKLLTAMDHKYGMIVRLGFTNEGGHVVSENWCDDAVSDVVDFVKVWDRATGELCSSVHVSSENYRDAWDNVQKVEEYSLNITSGGFAPESGTYPDEVNEAMSALGRVPVCEKYNRAWMILCNDVFIVAITPIGKPHFYRLRSLI